jgi:integrase
VKGSVFPRPHKWAIDKHGRRVKAAVRKGERYQLADGVEVVAPNASSWSWQLTIGSRKRGSRRTVSKGGFRKKTEAEEALAEAVARHNRGDRRHLQPRCDQTVGEHLDEWLAACRVRAHRPLKPSTAHGYESAINVWIRPSIGEVELADLDGDDLVGLYRTLRSTGGRSLNRAKMRPLGPRSVQLTHTILRKALAAAVEVGKIPMSPIDRIPADDRPSHTPRKLSDRHWQPDEARRFLAATVEDRLHPLWCLALDLGARRGELAGLRWSDVDLKDARVSIARNRVLVGGEIVETTPKSERSARRVGIDRGTVAVLRRWKAAQGRERMLAGDGWSGGDDPHLFADEVGRRPYRPDLLSDRFGEAQATVDVPRLSFHGLRHTTATIALDAGVPVHVVSQRLGHATVSITMDTYAHVLKHQETDAAERIGSVLYGIEGSA